MVIATVGWRRIPNCSTRSLLPEAEGYTATRHQREVGVGYFDAVASSDSGGLSSTTAFAGSTEADQFHDAPRAEIHRGDEDGLVSRHEWAVAAK